MSPFVITADLLLIMGTFFIASLVIAFHIAHTTNPLVEIDAIPMMPAPAVTAVTTAPAVTAPSMPLEVVPRPPSPQAVHPAQLPVQSPEQAITLMRAEIVRAPAPIRLLHIQSPTKMETLYVKPTATPQSYAGRK